MIRRFNYTDRKKIKNEHIRITIIDDGKQKSFNAELYLDSYGFAVEAKVYIEAYYKTNFMRFKFGTINRIEDPKNTDLSEIRGTDLFYFRIKVVDESGVRGRILGSLSGIQPLNTIQESANRRSILPVNYNAKLGQRLFRIAFDTGSDYPVLEINDKIEDARSVIRSDIFLTTIYPSVIQEIAMRIISEQTNYEVDEDCWQSHWLKYFKNELKITLALPSPDDDEEAKCDWVDDVVEAFCDNKLIRSRFMKLIQS